MLNEHVLNFDKWKTSCENNKPIRVWIWLVYKITDNKCRLQLLAEFIQSQKKCHISPLIKQAF